jgi:hypothetical protein
MKLGKLAWIAAGGVVGAGALAVGAFVFVSAQEPTPAPGPPVMRLISAEQYRNTVRYVFGDDIQITANFPLMQRREGLVALGAATASMTPGALEQFDQAARAIAGQVVDPEHRATLVPCTPRAESRPDADCARAFLGGVGRYLYRRPLTKAELDEQVALAGAAAEQRGDFYQGLAYAMGGMMMSPEFLYIAEVSEPDPGRPGRYRLDAYSLASRLSLLLWNAAPDDALLKAAESGELHDRGGLARQVDRMLASPRLEEGVRGFFGDLLQFQEYESISKDPLLYPNFTFEASQAAHEQTLRMVTDHLLRREGDYRELFTTNQTVVNRALAPLYKTAAPVEAKDEWVAHALDRGNAAGLLTSVSFLAAHSHPGRSSPTLRGKAIREIFLCQRVPDPPPTVNFAVFENLSGKLTARARLKAHVSDPSAPRPPTSAPRHWRGRH